MNAEFGRHARILVMKYQGYRTAEICERMSITPNNLYVTLSRARAMLKACLEKEGKSE
jgi:DNA-directed RNA polymerase specialized sigma24 family protein